MISDRINYLNKENYTETIVFDYNNKCIASFVAFWNICDLGHPS